MDQHDQELLDKQLGRISPSPRRNAVILSAVIAVFLAGVTFGGFITEKTETMQIASDDAAMSLPAGAPRSLQPN
jgi:hypothetical protein